MNSTSSPNFKSLFHLLRLKVIGVVLGLPQFQTLISLTTAVPKSNLCRLFTRYDITLF